jgi:hypothetical protein
MLLTWDPCGTQLAAGPRDHSTAEHERRLAGVAQHAAGRAGRHRGGRAVSQAPDGGILAGEPLCVPHRAAPGSPHRVCAVRRAAFVEDVDLFNAFVRQCRRDFPTAEQREERRARIQTAAADMYERVRRPRAPALLPRPTADALTAPPSHPPQYIREDVTFQINVPYDIIIPLREVCPGGGRRRLFCVPCPAPCGPASASRSWAFWL